MCASVISPPGIPIRVRQHLTNGSAPLTGINWSCAPQIRTSSAVEFRTLFRFMAIASATEEAAPVGAVEAPEVEEAVEGKAGEALKPEAGEGKKAEGEGEKGKKARKPRSAGPHHPPYFEMVKEAILALDGKSGSSPYAIAKYMGEQHKEVLPANYRKVLAVQLRNLAAKGRLVKVKASFKLAAAEEKKPSAAKAKRRRSAKKPSAPKEAKKAVAPARPARAKRAKKAAPAPAKPKQPRSIRTANKARA